MKRNFKFKDVSIKSRLVLSNLAIVLVSALLVAGSLTAIFASFIYTFNGRRINAHLTDSLGFMSIYQLQIYVNNLESEALKSNPDDVLANEAVRDMCEEIQASGALLSFLRDGQVLYITPGYTTEELDQLVNEIMETDLQPDKPLFFTSTRGSVLHNIHELHDGSTFRILLANPTLNRIVGDNNAGMSRNLLAYLQNLLIWIGVIAVVVIVLMNVLLSVAMSKSLLEPLKRLTRATHEIRDGNLDCEVNYTSKNEIGQLCEDFDEMRQRLNESVKAQQQSEENRRELIAGISHDLGTPLTSIKGYVSGLIDGIADTPDKQAHYLRTIYTTACDMDQLVNELFLFSRLDMNSVPFYFDKVDMRAFLEDSYAEMESKLKNAGISLYLLDHTYGGVFCSVDRMQMRRVIINIMDNCIKYKRGEQGSVRLELFREEDELLLAIADDGVGVAQGELDKIFDSFYRTDRARSSSRKGNGLGLAITRQIVERHSGRIWALGRQGEGLTIFIQLPLIHTEIEENEEKQDGKEDLDH